MMTTKRMVEMTAKLAAVMAAHQRDLKQIERLKAENKELRAMAPAMGIDVDASLKMRGIMDVVMVSL